MAEVVRTLAEDKPTLNQYPLEPMLSVGTEQIVGSIVGAAERVVEDKLCAAAVVGAAAEVEGIAAVHGRSVIVVVWASRMGEFGVVAGGGVELDLSA